MAKRRAFPKIAWVAMCLLFSPLVHAQAPRQPGAVYDFDKKGEKPEPAPSRDISGTWEPASGPGGGIQGKGAMSMESCKRATPGGRYAVDLNPPMSDTGYA